MLAVLVALGIAESRYVLAAPTTYEGESFRGYSSENGGAIYSSAFALTVTNCVFTNCSSTQTGGAIFLEAQAGRFTASRCFFGLCYATASAGAFHSSSPTVELLDCMFVRCGTKGTCGSFYVGGGTGQNSVQCCTITEAYSGTYTYLMYRSPTVERDLNISFCSTSGSTCGLFLNSYYDSTDIRYVTQFSNTAETGGVLRLVNFVSGTVVSHIMCSNHTFGDTYRYFYIYTSSGKTCAAYISQCYFQENEERTLLYTDSTASHLGMGYSYSNLQASSFAGITYSNCYFETRTTTAFATDCAYINYALSTPQFTLPRQIQHTVTVGYGMLLFVE